MSFNWFNLNPKPNLQIRGSYIKWFNCFDRDSNSGHFWGLGLLQINKRHLFYIGHSGISILFIGRP